MVSDYISQGKDRFEIAPLMGLTTMQVAKYERELVRRWKTAYIENIDALKHSVTAGHKKIIREAMEQFEISKQEVKVYPNQKCYECHGTKVDDGNQPCEVCSATGLLTICFVRPGDPRHLREFGNALKALADLFGLNAPKESRIEAKADIDHYHHIDAHDATDAELAAIASGDFTVDKNGNAIVGGKQVAFPKNGPQ